MPATYSITRDDAIGVCYVALIVNDDTTTVWIRDDMNLGVQCDLMVADTIAEHVTPDDVPTDARESFDYVDWMVDRIRDDLVVMRNLAGVVDVSA